MQPAQVMALAEASIHLLLVIVGPLLLTALITGVVIGLIQALTQIQEMTLTFVPKIIAMGIALLLMLPRIGEALGDFMAQIGDLIVSG